MASYPKSPTHLTSGMMGFARMVEKIRLHECGDLGPDYHANLGRRGRLDGACCDFLRVNYADLRDRVLKGGSDEEFSSGASRRAVASTPAI